MHLLSPFSLNLPFYEHKQRPSYINKLWPNYRFIARFPNESFGYVRGSRVGWRVPPPLKNHKDIEFLSDTGPISLNNHKASKNSMLGHYRHASETPFKRRYAGGQMMTRLYWHLDPPSLIS